MLRMLGLALVLAAAPALAQPPAALPESAPRSSAERSFDAFAREWMAKVHALEERHRANPDVKVGATKPVVTYRGYGDEYSIELQPTGRPSAPYVGLLRYTEHVYSCTDMDAADCRVASTVPVTEIFRFKDGRWVY